MISEQTLEGILSDELLSKIEFHDVIDNLTEGKTFQELLNIPDSVMQDFYQIAIDYLDHQEFGEAADCFLFLCALSPLQSNLWIKLGLAEYNAKKFEEALEAYSMAMMCDADDPFPHLYSAYVYNEEKKINQCKDCLSICLKLINEHHQFSPLRENVLKFQHKLNTR